MGTSVVAKVGSTPCFSCSVTCGCSTQLPTFVPRHRRVHRTLRHQPNLAPTQSDHRDGFWQQQRQRLRHGPQAPAIRHRPGADKGGNKDAACPPGRVPSSTSATAALPRAPIPLPRPMGQHGSWPRCSYVSRMGKEWWEWCVLVLEASDLQPVRHNCTECLY